MQVFRVQVFRVWVQGPGPGYRSSQYFLNFWGRGGFRTAATSKMELFVIVVNGFQPLTIIKKSSILDIAVVLNQLLWASVIFQFLTGKLSVFMDTYLENLRLFKK